MIANSIRDGDNGLAVHLILDAIADHAKKKDFVSAEIYRDRLYDVDALALDAIIRANEMIDAEKHTYSSSADRIIREKCIRYLSGDEIGALVPAMASLVVEPGETLIEQGRSNQRLYIVNRGELKCVHIGRHGDVLVNHLGTGSMAGYDTFFSINVATSAVIALTRVQVQYLDKSGLRQLAGKHPHLETHLKSCCDAETTVHGSLMGRGLDRRLYHRYDISAGLMATVIKPDSGTPLSRPITGSISDISAGGLCFYLNSKQVKNLRMLTGRFLRIQITLPVGGGVEWVNLSGLVRGVQDHPQHKYSIHVEFDKVLTHERLTFFQQQAG